MRGGEAVINRRSLGVACGSAGRDARKERRFATACLFGRAGLCFRPFVWGRRRCAGCDWSAGFTCGAPGSAPPPPTEKWAGTEPGPPQVGRLQTAAPWGGKRLSLGEVLLEEDFQEEEDEEGQEEGLPDFDAEAAGAVEALVGVEIGGGLGVEAVG